MTMTWWSWEGVHRAFLSSPATFDVSKHEHDNKLLPLSHIRSSALLLSTKFSNAAPDDSSCGAPSESCRRSYDLHHQRNEDSTENVLLWKKSFPFTFTGLLYETCFNALPFGKSGLIIASGFLTTGSTTGSATGLQTAIAIGNSLTSLLATT